MLRFKFRLKSVLFDDDHGKTKIMELKVASNTNKFNGSFKHKLIRILLAILFKKVRIQWLLYFCSKWVTLTGKKFSIRKGTCRQIPYSFVWENSRMTSWNWTDLFACQLLFVCPWFYMYYVTIIVLIIVWTILYYTSIWYACLAHFPEAIQNCSTW